MKKDRSVLDMAAPPKVTKGEQTRRKIVEEAAQIFNRRGYDGSSLSQLMEATGLKKGGIYRYFSSKEELAFEAFDHSWKVAWRARMDHVDEKSTGVARLKQTIANFVERRPSIPGGCPILNTAVDSDDGNRMLRARVLKALKSWVGHLQAIVEQAIQDGEIRADADSKDIATLIVATLEGGMMMSRLERDDAALRRIQNHLNGYLENQLAR
jgi:TetR/AcrR family transcriptional regulator, transcriptional repressor for nem operon